jgi:hypothetical protein
LLHSAPWNNSALVEEPGKEEFHILEQVVEGEGMSLKDKVGENERMGLKDPPLVQTLPSPPHRRYA